MIKHILFLVSFSFVVMPLAAQQRLSSDKIIGKIGNSIVLQSDIEGQFQEEKRLNPDLNDTAKCDYLYSVLAQQVLIEQASRDSITVTEEEVEGQLNDRIRYWIAQYGSVEQLERVSGKTLYQLKDENRKFFRDKLIAERMQMQILQNVKVTPQEIETFFNNIPKDSLSAVPASVEIGQIIVKPEYSPELEKYAKDRMEEIRKEIVEGGRSFSSMAAIYSMDGTKDAGGEMTIDKKGFDPQFVSAAYRLQPNEISPVIRSKFGYHIIQMIRRQGEQALVRHIVIVPEISTADVNKTLAKLEIVHQELQEGKITFQQAVSKYSNDDNSKMTGGMYYSNRTGSSTLFMEELEPSMINYINEMKVGEFSKPHAFVDDMQQRSCRILYLRSRKDPHTLNLQDDYAQIKAMAEGEKKMYYLKQYIQDRISSFYVQLDEDYSHCEDLKEWYKVAAKRK